MKYLPLDLLAVTLNLLRVKSIHMPYHIVPVKLRYMKLRITSLLFLLSMSVFGLAHAELGDLYSAEVPANGEDASQRNRALSTALAEVMVRVSGSGSVTSRPAAGAIVGQASNLVQQYRYRLEDVDPAVNEAGDLLPPKRFLWARFDKISVNRLMRQADIPVWSGQRPRVLLWLGLQTNASRQLHNLDADSKNLKLISQRAQKRGMPLQLPLLDLEDQSKLSAADLWADYETAIREASARYPNDVILTGRLRDQGEGRWGSQWTLLSQSEIETFGETGLGWRAALRLGIDGAQDLLAAKYAPASGGDGPEKLLVRFTQIDSQKAYGQLMAILARQDSITKSSLDEVQGDTLLMNLWVRGGRSALARGLALGGELFQQDTEALIDESVPVVNNKESPPSSPEEALEQREAQADMTFSLLH